jgi:hypothetical protein
MHHHARAGVRTDVVASYIDSVAIVASHGKGHGHGHGTAAQAASGARGRGRSGSGSGRACGVDNFMLQFMELGVLGVVLHDNLFLHGGVISTKVHTKVV